MIVDIFIRTYSKDLQWLKYCLRSISKYVTGHRNIIICIPQDEKHLMDSWNLTNEKVYGWIPLTDDGYIDQQISKLMAHEYTDADYILYVDSDVCFFRHTDVSKEYFVNEKPILMKTRYELVGDAICWKECTENILNKEIKFEYMRRIPWLYSTDTTRAICHYYDYRELAKLKRLSEFNLMGAYIDLYQQDKYHIIDTEKDSIPPACAKQLWSWSGCTDEDKNQMEEYLK